VKHTPFHLSIPCSSIDRTREFYVGDIGATLGRNSTRWLDIDLFGHQITFTRSGDFNFSYRSYKFEETVLPSFHFGVIVDRKTWERLYHRLKQTKHSVTPEITFLSGKKGEHASFFIEDPNGHSVEFKCFRNQKEMFD